MQTNSLARAAVFIFAMLNSPLISAAASKPDCPGAIEALKPTRGDEDNNLVKAMRELLAMILMTTPHEATVVRKIIGTDGQQFFEATNGKFSFKADSPGGQKLAKAFRSLDPGKTHEMVLVFDRQSQELIAAVRAETSKVLALARTY